MTSNADDRDLIDAIEAWAEKELRPVARKFDQADEYPHEIVEQMKELGLFGATISPEYGGLGLSAWTYAQIVMKVSAIWMAPCGIFNSHLIMAAALAITIVTAVQSSAPGPRPKNATTCRAWRPASFAAAWA